jgi:uncharacterized Zn-binding protein involved in type VI secretion
MQALITVGCMTDHGAVISIGESSFMVDGKAVHLDGMTHFCPKCKVQSRAIASNQGFMMVGGKSIVAVGDKSTCGSKYLKISDLAVMSNGRGNGGLQAQASTSNFLKPINKEKYVAQFKCINKETNEVIKNRKYYILKENGEKKYGITNDSGLTEIIETEQKEDISIHFYFVSPSGEIITMEDIAP